MDVSTNAVYENIKQIQILKKINDQPSFMQFKGTAIFKCVQSAWKKVGRYNHYKKQRFWICCLQSVLNISLPYIYSCVMAHAAFDALECLKSRSFLILLIGPGISIQKLYATYVIRVSLIATYAFAKGVTTDKRYRYHNADERIVGRTSWYKGVTAYLGSSGKYANVKIVFFVHYKVFTFKMRTKCARLS